ncbi:cytochrome c oxidase subunit II [Pollutimonas bauzanensis]|uniref:cytochrome-c oxidase n=1 Tax=Pollutimonas bauzanensis TaxID=658167 RepID=A0A1M5WAA1_9BURK|nr:cytochrome c oxidase subunit II [Pollutimonas bauzanensis]SHH84391.1 cytochrome c oxidase subunit 2 [Pollutimonas bauzanensis]
MSDNFTLLGPSASEAAGRSDILYLALVGFSTLIAGIFLGVIIWFCFRYRRNSPADRSNAPSHGGGLEAAWTIAPLLVFLGLFAWAAKYYAEMYRPPADATPVFVVGRQWMWKIEHGNGRREINELHVPIDTPVKLVMASQDVIHSFFVPAFRQKQDVVPGRYSILWFKANKEGVYHLLCAEYCGTDHASMIGRVMVMQPQDYARWLEEGTSQPGMAQRGFTLFREHGCAGCHSTGSTVHAPLLAGLLGRSVHLEDGSILVADETYVHDSIVEPQKQMVAGYAPIMPSFKGQLSEEDIMAIIEYIRASGDPHTEKQQP